MNPNPLDKFGKLIATKLLDAAIDKVDGLLAGHWRAPSLLPLQTELTQLTAEQRALVRLCVIESIDTGIHDFLFALVEAHDFNQGIEVLVDSKNIVEISDGLQLEPYSEDGWYARHSKHGCR